MAYENAQNIDREIGWDEDLSNKGGDFVLLPAGIYEYEVTKFERARHPGSANLGPCNKAIITVQIRTPNGMAVWSENLFMHTKTQRIISSFFVSIGQARPEDEVVRPNWGAVVGSRGICEVEINIYRSQKSGEERENNRVKRWLAPNPEANVLNAPGATAQPAQRSWANGSF